MAGILDFLVDDLPAWDRGLLDAHRISAGPVHNVRRSLELAKRSRRSPLNWVLWNRRRYYEGLIEGFERALEWHERKHRHC